MNTEKVLGFFQEITRIPRESGHEEQIVAYLQQFAAARGLACKTDEVGNVMIAKPASKGYEDHPTVVLQGHTDMVCEKKSTSDFDFSKDPIHYVIEDGWMVAHDTTLGADNGIGVATAMAILDDDTLPHPRVECLFTVSEETGLDGARAVKKDFISGKTLINLDDEDEGYFCVGCAGGMDTVGTFKYIPMHLTTDHVLLKFTIGGGQGGHSGDDIDKGRINGVQQTARFVNEVWKYHVELCRIAAGNKRNAIARGGEVILAVPTRQVRKVVAAFADFAARLKAEYAVTDPGLYFEHEKVEWKKEAIDTDTARRVIAALLAIPHGVIAMSADIPGLIETSTNLASVKMEEGRRIVIGTAQLGQQPADFPLAAHRRRSGTCRRESPPYRRLSRLETQYALAREGCLRGFLQASVRPRTGGPRHPRRPGVRPVHREIPRRGHDRLRSDPARCPCPRRTPRPGLARPFLCRIA